MRGLFFEVFFFFCSTFFELFGRRPRPDPRSAIAPVRSADSFAPNLFSGLFCKPSRCVCSSKRAQPRSRSNFLKKDSRRADRRSSDPVQPGGPSAAPVRCVWSLRTPSCSNLTRSGDPDLPDFTARNDPSLPAPGTLCCGGRDSARREGKVQIRGAPEWAHFGNAIIRGSGGSQQTNKQIQKLELDVM